MTENDTSTTEFDTETDDRTRREIDLGAREYSIYKCQNCANVVLSMQDCDGGMTCHGDEMKRVTQSNLEIRPPDIRQVLLDAFGLPKPGLDICLCVIGDGPLSSKELAAQLDYEGGTIRKYLNELVEFGLLEKSQLNRESGGFVNVYHSIDLDEMRTETLIGFYIWAGEAASLIEEANLTKEDYLDADYDSGLDEIFWERFRGSGGSE
ncbi:ArsR family transcriptional regulator [Haloarcula sp. Atlit-7R]|uniref:ArsR family transcriptional regulator n=1 Tax=Haloarcula sp. Atlit-7R TaxID=2282125 RepID=UPI000EF14BD2|nr:ArsR family transcriptional regulator [Haloarcula sp. Atlit-7R]RLM95280.1 ArsR family transcriptional regulator [Haloarcula sp. Atlit-7R]